MNTRAKPQTKKSPWPIAGIIGGAILILAVLLVFGLSGPDVDERWQRAQSAAQAGDWKAASIDLRSLLQTDPDHSVARALYGESLLELGDGCGG